MQYDASDNIPIFVDEDEALAGIENPDLSRGDRLAAEMARNAMQHGYDAAELSGYKTIAQRQADDLKYESADGTRYWLSRTGVADGEPFENTVTIEILVEGRWETICKYDGGDGESYEEMEKRKDASRAWTVRSFGDKDASYVDRHAVYDGDGELRAKFWIQGDADRYARERNRALGIGETGDAQAEVGEALRGRIEDIEDLQGLADDPDCVAVGGRKITSQRLGELGVSPEWTDPEWTREQATQALEEYPLCVERTTLIEVVLGTGGPDDRLIFECSGGPLYHGVGDDSAYEIRRVLYRYSWDGSAERELSGDDKATAERFGRMIVPELERAS